MIRRANPEFFNLTKNLKRVAILSILLATLSISCLAYILTLRTKAAHSVQLEFSNDLERMSYAQKTALPDEYKKHCPPIVTSSDDVACLFSAYEALLKEAKFYSWDLFYNYKSRMADLAKNIDKRALPQSEAATLFIVEEESYVRALEARVRENATMGI